VDDRSWRGGGGCGSCKRLVVWYLGSGFGVFGLALGHVDGWVCKGRRVWAANTGHWTGADMVEGLVSA
jgi:hypothetical protein